MPVQVRQFSDLNLDLIPSPISGDISPLRNADAVKRSVRNLILTNLYERPFRPNIGSRVTHLLFEPMDTLTKIAIRDEIVTSLTLNEPRAKIIDIEIRINLEENGYQTNILFSIENFSQVFEVDIFLERVR